MAHKQFVVSDINPNDTTGGRGCVCDPAHQVDCKPPYAIFYGNDMESIASPHVVICQSCVAAVATQMAGEIMRVGEVMDPLPVPLPEPVIDDAEVVEDDADAGPRRPGASTRWVAEDDVPEV